MSDPDVDSLIVKVNLELKKVTDFFRTLKLSLHPDKTKYILITNSPLIRAQACQITLNFNNESAVHSPLLIKNLTRVTLDSPVPAIKFLGIFIDPLLNFKFHINFVAGKVSKALFFLRAVKKTLSTPALKSIYYTTVHSHFIYGINIWSCTLPSNLNILMLKQKIAIRTIMKSKYNAHTEPLFKSLNILPLNMLIEYFNLQLFHRFTISELPASFTHTWIRNEDRRNQNNPILRNNLDYQIQASRLVTSDKFPLFNLPRTWSNFHEPDIKSCLSKN